MANGLIDPIYAKILDSFYWNTLYNDLDLLIVCVGRERVGKTTLNKNTASYINRIRNEYWGLPATYDQTKHLAYSPLQFAELVTSAGKKDGLETPGGVVIYDEAVTGFNSRKSASTPNIALNSILMQCGQYNLVMLLNIPSFFGLDLQVRARRVAMVCHVKASHQKIKDENGRQFNKITRGYFDLYVGSDVRKIKRDPESGAEIFPKPTHENLRFSAPTDEFKTEEKNEEKRKTDNMLREVQRLKAWEQKTYEKKEKGRKADSFEGQGRLFDELQENPDDAVDEVEEE